MKAEGNGNGHTKRIIAFGAILTALIIATATGWTRVIFESILVSRSSIQENALAQAREERVKLADRMGALEVRVASREELAKNFEQRYAEELREQKEFRDKTEQKLSEINARLSVLIERSKR